MTAPWFHDRRYGRVRSPDSVTSIRNLYILYTVSSKRKSIPVSLPPALVRELDRLVEEGKFGSRSEAIRYGARLVTREDRLLRLHELTEARAAQDVDERLERKRVP